MNRLLAAGVISIFVWAFPTPLPAQTAAEHVIGIDDVIAIHVADHPELSSEKVQVSLSGSITHPVWGEVQAEGLTARQLQAKLNDRLAADFIADPNVAVSVLQVNQTLVWLIAAPGAFSGSQSPTNIYRLGVSGKLSELVILSGVSSEFCKRMLITITRSACTRPACTRRTCEPLATVKTADTDAPQAPAPELVSRTTVSLYDLMLLNKKELDIPLQRNDRLQFIRRDPKNDRRYAFNIGQATDGQAQGNPADRPPAAPARETRIPLEPDVLVLVGDPPPVIGNQVHVLGDVEAAGAISLTDDMTLGAALAKARLSAKAGALSRIVLVRRAIIAKAQTFYPFSSSLGDSFGITERLLPGDFVFVLGDQTE